MAPLHNQFVRDRVHVDRLVQLVHVHEMAAFRLFHSEHFGVQAPNVELAGGLLELGHTFLLLLETFGVTSRLHVLNTQHHFLLDHALTHTLVDQHLDGALQHIHHTTGASVVVLVGHALLHGAIALDVHQLAAFVHIQVGGNVLSSVLAERATEQVTSTTAVSFRVDHFDGKSRASERLWWNGKTR